MMKAKEVIELLQHYQHDLMNDFQVIHGYLSMDKLDIAKDKADDFINHFNEGRKLLKINAPKFILWVMPFNHNHDNIRLTYEVKSERLNLQTIDDLLVQQCKQLTQSISELGMKTEVYQIHLQIGEQTPTEFELQFFVIGQLKHEEGIMSVCKDLEDNPQVNMNVKETKHGYKGEFIFSMK